MSLRRLLPFGLCAALLACGSVASAQSFGTFRWQLLPYCNVVTLNVTAQGSIYSLDGYDDQCGAGQRAGVVGTAFQNPDSTIGIGLNTVLAPGGGFVHVEARISLASLGGPWRDSAGNTGMFSFTPGLGAGGPVRPVAANGLPPASITADQLAPGAVGAGQINAGQVQMRVSGTCPQGRFVNGINPDGTVGCGTNVITKTFQGNQIRWTQKTIFNILYREAELSVPELTAAVVSGGSVQVFGAFNFGQPWTALPVTYFENSTTTSFFYGVKTGAVVVRVSLAINADPGHIEIPFKVVLVLP